MKKISIFIELTRLNKPIGFLLLFWPCLWGLTLANYQNQNNLTYIYYLILFFLGSVLMRSVGCIINDIVDKKFDKKVLRTKFRPIASGEISVLNALVYVFILCLLALIILLQFNFLTISLGIASMFLAFSYPYMKRFTYWPQLFLGLTFNWGIIMAWTAMNNAISIEPIILYISAIFWTLGYDTVYGLQDIKDDEIIGLKSTAIKFKNSAKIFVGACYFLFTLFLLSLAIIMDANKYFYILLIVVILQLFYQIRTFKKDNPTSCLKVFKSNNYVGLVVFLCMGTFSFL